ncbi:class I SAM-dependent methyltransferase [Desulfobacterales bacterium HSG17]|nr:class I SAM-dependent methyltransferase [Desulfobacterales bacterium HSG17]
MMKECLVCGKTEVDLLFEKNGYQIVRCRHDGHIYVANPPTLAELGDFYAAAYFEGKNEVGYHHNVFEERDHHLKKANRKLGLLTRFLLTGKVLDVGSGPGFFVKQASHHFDSIGCEFSEAAVQYAQKELGVELFQGDFLDYQGGPFNAVTMWSYLEHALEPRKALMYAADLLVPGGYLLLSIPNVEGVGRYAKGKSWRGFSPPEHLHFFTKANFKRLFAETGFEYRDVPFSMNHFFRDTVYFCAQKK